MTTMTVDKTPPAQTAPIRQERSGLMGDMNDFFADQLAFMRGMIHQAPVVEVRFAYVKAYSMNTPAGVRHVLQTNNKNYIKEQRFMKVVESGGESSLFTTDGDEWLWRRRLMQPAFHRRQIANFGQIMTEEAQATAQRWANANGTLNMEDEMMDLTLQIIGRAMLSVNMRQDGEELHAAYNWWGPFILKRTQSILPLPLWIPTADHRKFNEVSETIDGTLWQIIEERLKSDEEHLDLLQMLLYARDEEDGTTFTREQLIRELSGIVFAGHETTAATLTWAWYVLSQRPDLEAKLHEELEEVLNGRLPTIDDLPKFDFLPRFLKETMRVYPPAYVTNRQSVEEDVVEGYKIPANTQVLINIYGLHHDPQYWANPDTFDPDHFLPEAVAERPKEAYIPFLMGPRKCIGELFSMTEAQLILATLAQQYRAHLATPPPVKPVPKFALRTENGIPMTVQKR